MSEARARYRVRKAPTIYDSQDEESWQESLIGPKGHATVRGWESYHQLDSRRVQGAGGEGFVDLVLIHLYPDTPGRVVYAELKREGGRVTDDERRWLEALVQCEQEAYLWVPSDIDEVIRILESPVRVDSETEWRRVRERADAGR